MNATRIVYTVRSSDSAYVEVPPSVIADFLNQGLGLDIRIMPAK